MKQTKVFKNAYNNWQAETAVLLTEERLLKVSTLKRSSGEVCTTASCYKVEGNSLVSIPMGENKDFYKALQRAKFRGTEKSVLEFHMKVNFEEIIAEARAYYNIPAEN